MKKGTGSARPCIFVPFRPPLLAMPVPFLSGHCLSRYGSPGAWVGSSGAPPAEGAASAAPRRTSATQEFGSALGFVAELGSAARGGGGCGRLEVGGKGSVHGSSSTVLVALKKSNRKLEQEVTEATAKDVSVSGSLLFRFCVGSDLVEFLAKPGFLQFGSGQSHGRKWLTGLEFDRCMSRASPCHPEVGCLKSRELTARGVVWGRKRTCYEFGAGCGAATQRTGLVLRGVTARRLYVSRLAAAGYVRDRVRNLCTSSGGFVASGCGGEPEHFGFSILDHGLEGREFRNKLRGWRKILGEWW